MKYILSITLVLLTVISIQAQSKTKSIKGNVYAFKNASLNKVMITTKKSKDTVYTDIFGNFIIKVQSKDLLKIENEAFETYSQKVKNNNDVKIKLIYLTGDKAYNLIVDSENLTQEKLDYCINNEIGENNNYAQMGSIYQIIQNVYPPAKVMSIEGSTRIVLNSRGINSASADTSALLVVDDIIVSDITSIRPIEVQSVEVFVGNDAAHWGVRASNGVIEIKLKKGSL